MLTEPKPPLYARALGDTWQRLPEAIRRMHDVDGALTATGRADIDRGTHPLARLVAIIVGFPAAARDVPVTVRFTVDGNTEHWQRTFAGRRFASIQTDLPARQGAQPTEPAVLEMFGPVTIVLGLVFDGTRLNVIPRRWSILGVPLPASLVPGGDTFEFVDTAGRFNFHVEITHPWFGLIVRYRGHLSPMRPE